MTPHSKRKLIHIWRRHLRPILVLILIFTAGRSSLLDWNDVPTGSMKPTIFEGDRILVNKLAYGLKIPFTTIHLAKWSEPKRGEIAVFYSPADGVRLVKRVVGLPGDRIKMVDGRLIINDQPLAYTPYVPDNIASLPPDQQRYYQFFTEQLDGHAHVIALASPQAFGGRTLSRNDQYTVPPGHYFMMGDNRDNSNDSRFIGAVPRDQIVGRAGRVIFSLDYNDYYLPRKNRFFHALP